jgi:glycosyltransferase involved in cell wall biosynthesis
VTLNESLVIPCYNEAARLPTADFSWLIASRPRLTLLFVDDGSTDATAEVIRRIRAAAGERVLLHRLERNVGKAEAVRHGMRMALDHGAGIVGYADADLSTPAGELARMLARIEAGPAAVILGSRVRLLGAAIRRRTHRHYLGRMFATAASVALRLPVYDTQCGAKLFRRSDVLIRALEEPFRSRWIFDVELLDRLLRGAGDAPPLCAGAFEEMPLRSWRDVAGSKLRFTSMMRAGLQLGAMLVRSRVRPLPSGVSTRPERAPSDGDAGRVARERRA